MRTGLAWGGLAAALCLPLALATASPLMQWRGPVYVTGCLAGIAALSLLLLQPLLASNRMPGLSPRQARRLHRLGGAVLAGAVGLHVGGLWITSPPDMIDALLFAAPAAFSLWGVLAFWLLAAAVILAALRHRAGLRSRRWHSRLACAAAGGSIVHAMLVQGLMEPVSKTLLCLCVAAAGAGLLRRRRASRAERPPAPEGAGPRRRRREP
nr:ferric reductase [Mangrovicoccus algicola]